MVRLVDWGGLLFISTLTLLSLISIVHYSRKIRGLKQINEVKSDRITNDLTIGISSGLIVFLFTFAAEKLNLGSNLNLTSFKDFIISLLGSLISLFFQITLIIAIVSWAMYQFLKISLKEHS